MRTQEPIREDDAAEGCASSLIALTLVGMKSALCALNARTISAENLRSAEMIRVNCFEVLNSGLSDSMRSYLATSLWKQLN